jgi:branched-chain amino acid transport system substrate-binding protein
VDVLKQGVVVIMLSCGLWLLGCQQDSPKDKPVDTVRIGAIYPLTGHSRSAGQDIRAAVQLAEAINRAGSTDPALIRGALLKTNIPEKDLIMPWDGVKFDPDTGQNVLGKGLIVQVHQGQYVTVWPEGLSTKPIVWPMPPWSKRTKKNRLPC